MMIKDNFWIGLSYLVVGTLVGWPMFLLIQLTLVFLFGIVAFWFFYVQHQHDFSYKQWKHNWDFLISAIRGSSYYKLPRVFHWLTGNIGIHHVHHMSSGIPFYRLPEVLRDYPELEDTSRLTFWASFKCARLKLWDEANRRLVTFKEARALGAAARA